MSVRVYVGGLSYQAREDDIKDLFRKFGKPHDISLKKGFAFVEFNDDRDADDACYELNGKKFMGERVIIERAKGMPHGRDKDRWGGDDRRRGRSPARRFDRDRRMGGPAWLDKYGPPTRTNHRLVVQNLSSTISWQDLKDYMRKAGEVTYADVNKERRNEGVVEFRDYRDLEKAIEKLDDTELKGRRIKLVEENRKRTRSQSHSRSRSRSRSRGRRTKRTKSRSRSRSRSKSRSRSRSKSALDHKSTSRYSKSGTTSRSRSKEYKRKTDKYEDRRSKEKFENERNKEEESDRGRKISPDSGKIKLEAMDVDRDHSNLNGKYRG